MKLTELHEWTGVVNDAVVSLAALAGGAWAILRLKRERDVSGEGHRGCLGDDGNYWTSITELIIPAEQTAVGNRALTGAVNRK